jgi:hypothetical protein
MMMLMLEEKKKRASVSKAESYDQVILTQAWAWTAAVVLSIIGIIMSVVSIVTGNIGSIISLAINGVILYCLYRPHVKAYFGKAVPSTPADTATA